MEKGSVTSRKDENSRLWAQESFSPIRQEQQNGAGEVEWQYVVECLARKGKTL